MAENKVFEGRAELNLKPYLDSLKSLEQQSDLTLGKVQDRFKAFDEGLGKSVEAIKSNVGSISSAIQQVAGVLNGITQGLNTVIGTQQKVANEQAKTAQASTTAARTQAAAASSQSQSSDKASKAALSLAQAQARGLAITGEYTKAVDLLKKALDANGNAPALQRQNAENQIVALQQKRMAALKAIDDAEKRQLRDAAQEKARLQREADATEERSLREGNTRLKGFLQQLAREKAAAARADAQSEKATQQARLVEMKAATDREIEEMKRSVLARANAAKDPVVVLAIREELRREIAEMERGIKEQQEAQQRALRAAAQQQQTIAAVNRGQAVALPGQNPQNQYAESLRAAEFAAEKEKQLRKSVTALMSVEGDKMEKALKQAYRRVSESATDATGGIITGGQKLSAAWNGFISDLATVENRLNSVYRAGSQIGQFGRQMLGAGQQIAGFSANLEQSAGDFDFWVRRTSASAKAAQANSDLVLNSSQKALASAEEFQERSLQIGRQLGVLSPEQIAQGFFVYQSAVGEAITSTDDLAIAQKNLDVLMKAAIVTDTDSATVIRGVTSAMAEFGLGIEQTDYVTSLLVSTTQLTQAEFSDLLEGFKYVGPQARRLGIDIADVSAAFAVLADNNIRGSQAGRLFASGMGNIIKPTREMDEALQHLLISNQGLSGSWRDLVFQGGEFVGLFDKLDEQGKTTQKGFLHLFSDATKDMSNAQREFYIGTLFGKESSKVWGTLVDEYARNGAIATDANQQVARSFEGMAATMRDPQTQIKAFGDQWQEVSSGIKIQTGLMTFAFQELKVRLGTIVAAAILPMVDKVRGLIYLFLEWAKANPEVASTLVRVTLGLGAFLLVGGGAFLVMGQLIQAATSMALAFKVAGLAASFVSTNFANIGNAIFKFVPVIAGVQLPIIALIAAIVALGLAWRYNWFGIRDAVAEVMPQLKEVFFALVNGVRGVAEVLTGIFNGNDQLVTQGALRIANGLLAIFIGLGGSLAQVLIRIASNIGGTLNQTFGYLSQNMAVWGHNLLVALANGMISALQSVVAAAFAAAEAIARFFRSFSPPKFGPLREISTWGKNLIGALTDGMAAADFDAVSEVADKIGAVLKQGVEENSIPASIYAATVGSANNLVDDMLKTVRGGGRVGEEFFASLQPALGEWYGYITKIAVAYQEVYANQRGLEIEKQRLALIQAQRKELQAQNQARLDAFEQYLNQSNTASATNNQQAAVDPTTKDGQTKIEEMRKKLSKEDFQNWINFQKQLFQSRSQQEDKRLAAEEETAQVSVNTFEAQLKASQEQYNTYVKMYEYAQKMYNLAKEQKQLEEQKQKAAAGAAAAGGTYGTPEQLQKFIDEINQLIGGDLDIAFTDSLEEATSQAEREKNRLAELEKLNKQKVAEFEAALINANSEEERTRIKQQKDAWDAAYKQEKAHLQERIADTKRIADSLKQNISGGIYGDPEELQKFRDEIQKIVGDDLEISFTDNGDEATKQKEREQNRLTALEEENRKKQAQFEVDLINAKSEEDRRRIKEQKDAWDAAYKEEKANLQQRVEQAKQIEKSIKDSEKAAAKVSAAGGGAGKGFNPPDFGGGPGVGELGLDSMGFDTTKIGEQVNHLFDGFKLPEIPEADSLKFIEPIQRGLAYLTDDSITAEEKLKKVGDVLRDALNSSEVEKWADDTNERFNKWVLDQTNNIQKWADDTNEKFNKWVLDIPTKIQQWADDTNEKFNKWVLDQQGNIQRWADDTNQKFNKWVDDTTQPIQKWAEDQKKVFDQFVEDAKLRIAIWVDNMLKPLYFIVGVFGITWEAIKAVASIGLKFLQDKFNEFWEWAKPYVDEGWKFIKQITDNVIADLKLGWEKFVNGMKVVWDAVGPVLSAAWDAFVKDWKKKYDDFIEPLGKLWDTFLSGVSVSYHKWVDPIGIAWDTFLRDWDKNYHRTMDVLATAWDLYVQGWKQKYDDFIAPLGPLWDAFVQGLSTVYHKWVDPIATAWATLTQSFNDAKPAIDNVSTAIGKIIDYGRSILGMKPPQQSNTSTTSSGSGSSSGGKGFADGLYSVPYNMYPAYLHANERVLTAQEAAVYNAAERNVKQQQAFAQMARGNVTNNGGDRITNINVAEVNASNPAEGRAFLEKIAFFSS